MDPFSIVVGSVALVETANNVATVLIDTYRTYTNAPTEMVEIADQITTCSGLVDVFANSIKGTKLPKEFHYVAQNLVDQVSLVNMINYRHTYLLSSSAKKPSKT
jgi:hypothetical protein